jgi:hypothetical protein
MVLHHVRQPECNTSLARRRGRAAIPQTVHYARAYVFMCCRQNVGHMARTFQDIAGLTIEPARKGPAACLRYMQNQAAAAPLCWPDDGVEGWFANAAATFERKMSGEITVPWGPLIQSCLREGTPWYVVGRAALLRGRARRTAFRHSTPTRAAGAKTSRPSTRRGFRHASTPRRPLSASPHVVCSTPPPSVARQDSRSSSASARTWRCVASVTCGAVSSESQT